LDALPGTELGGGLCRDAAERRGGAYIWKQFILQLVHKHTANTALQTVNRSLRQAGSVQGTLCLEIYLASRTIMLHKETETNIVRSLIIVFLKMIKFGGLGGKGG
jgi:hypothetical protein